MRTIHQRNLASSVAFTALGIAMLVGAAPAFAQDADSTPSVSNQPSGETQQASPPAAQSEIVVTGSRISRRDYEANSPIVTVTPEAFESRSAVTVESTLNQLPQFSQAGSGSSALASSAGTAFTGPDQAPGAATLNLRGLGANRTLVLVNGRRAQPVNGQLLVDVNTIPTDAIKNVEVISGGAAAVYGADAIAGVVNFILRDNFEGLQLNSQYGIADAGDNQTAQISGLVGGNFGDGRGNAMLGVSWSKRGKAWQKNRKFYTNGWKDPNTSAAGGGLPITEAVVNGITWGVNPDGSLFNANYANDSAAPYTGPLNQLVGGAGFKLNPPTTGTNQQTLGFNDPYALVNVPLTRYSIFGSAHYDITDAVTAYVEGNFTHSSAYAQSFSGTASGIWAFMVPYDQANDDPASPTFGANQNNFHPVSAQLATLLNSRADVNGVPGTAQPWTLNRGLNFLGDLYTQTNSDIYQITVGLKGEVGISDWTWDLYGSHGNTSVVARQPQGAISYANLQQLISGTNSSGVHSTSISGPYSAGWSSQATFNPNFCTSGIPFFNADGSVPSGGTANGDSVTVSDDCKNYATLELNNITTLKQNIVEGTMQGKLFDWWAGEVRFAAGATYRSESFAYAPDTGNSGEQNSTGVVNQIVLPDQTKGSINVKEIYGEMLIPLVKDVPLIRALELEVGGRYSDYSLSGTVGTYKILGNWKVNDWIRFRGGYQLANRAPNVYELFAPVAGSLIASADPCINVAGETPSFGNTPSNPNLVNLQAACKALIVRDGGYPYVTLGEDPSAIAQDVTDPNLDQTRLSNLRWKLGYNFAFPYSIGLTQGNTGLKSEKAHTITLGAVINSPFETPLLHRLTLTADYYSINLKDTISAPSGTLIYNQCLNPLYNPLIASAAGSVTGDEILQGNPYCNLIQRYPYDSAGNKGAIGSGTDRSLKTPFLNMGATKTSGLDLTADWTLPFDAMGLSAIPGALNINASANILFEYKQQAFAGAPFVSYKGTLEQLSYDYKLFGTVTYLWDHGSVGLRGNYLPKIDPSPNSAPGVYATDPHVQFDLFGQYQINSALEIRAGIDNLFNAQPEIVGATASNAASNSTISTYDSIGRAYFIGLKMRL